MKNVEQIPRPEILDIGAKLEAIHRDIKLLKEKSSQEYLDLLFANLKKDFLISMKSYISDDIENQLEKCMVDPCKMRKTCKSRFTDFLTKNSHMFTEEVNKDLIDEKRAELSEMEKEAAFNKCGICFSEVNELFDKQISLIDSLQIYNNNVDKKTDIASISDEKMVKNVLEPLANKQRLQILKSMASRTRTFSNLSELTGLRGGNLLFHLQ
ncbi:MAG TPA: ArsR family transcriptional regulator, partial [Methanobacterium sp.]|nr:ArsR family transcriptional regulator [Methanobacterium sp.]